MEEKMKFDIISFGIGFAVAGLVVLIVYLIGNKLRHKCKYPDCGCKTTTYYRMIRIHNVPVTKGGLSIYAVYKFRVCDHNHVLPEMKTKMFSQEQIRSKPASEFDWSSDHINRICALAGIDNPNEDYIFRQLKDPNYRPRIPVNTFVSGHHIWPAVRSSPAKKN
jgi:hypothetical protein